MRFDLIDDVGDVDGYRVVVDDAVQGWKLRRYNWAGWDG
jgi:hypothetical protein